MSNWDAQLPPRAVAVARRQEQGLLREGLVTGLVGAAAVAGWFLVLDVLMGRPLHTPALLGAIVTGAVDPLAAAVGSGRTTLAGLYSFVHVSAFAAVGVLATLLVAHAERTPSLLALLLLLFAAVEVAFTGFVALLEAGALGDIAWYAVAAGNVVAAVAMGWQLRRNHPTVLDGWGRAWVDEPG